MPRTAATSGISLAEQHLANMLADAPAFRALASGVTTAEQAHARMIHYDALPPPEGDQAVHTPDELNKLRPFAILFTAEQNGYRRRRTATGCFVESGQIVLHLECNIPAALASDRSEALRRFKNSLGAILDDLEPLTEQAGYLAANAFDVQMLALEAEDAIPMNGDNVFAIVTIPWGAE